MRGGIKNYLSRTTQEEDKFRMRITWKIMEQKFDIKKENTRTNASIAEFLCLILSNGGGANSK